MTVKKRGISTKEKIEEIAIHLLNERGLANVTMRDVSTTLGISIGNLTYHFPKWEDIIDSIFTSLQHQLNNLYNDFPKDLSEVVRYIGQIFDLQMHYAFILSNYYIFFETYPRYNSIKDQFFQTRMNVMRHAFERLIDKKLLYRPNMEHNYDILVKNTWIILTGWYSFSKMFNDDTYSVSKENFFFSIWNLCFPHLTTKGKRIVIKTYFNYKKNETGSNQ